MEGGCNWDRKWAKGGKSGGGQIGSKKSGRIDDASAILALFPGLILQHVSTWSCDSKIAVAGPSRSLHAMEFNLQGREQLPLRQPILLGD